MKLKSGKKIQKFKIEKCSNLKNVQILKKFKQTQSGKSSKLKIVQIEKCSKLKKII
jgi:hypothetical protein